MDCGLADVDGLVLSTCDGILTKRASLLKTKSSYMVPWKQKEESNWEWEREVERSRREKEKNVPLQKLLGRLSFMAFSVQSLGGAQEELLGSLSGSAVPRALSCAGTPTSFLRCMVAAARRSIISKLFKRAYSIPHPSTNDECFLKTYWRANSSQDFWARKQTF